MAKWTFLFFQWIHFLMEKSFPFFEKNNLKHSEKYPLHAKVPLYMLGSNGDELSIGGVCLIWWGYSAGWCALYGMWQWAHKALICQPL